MILSNVLTFGKFAVSRKPIINGGDIRPVGLLFLNWPNVTLGKVGFGLDIAHNNFLSHSLFHKFNWKVTY